MKKRLALALVFIMLLSIVAGCSGKKTDTDLAKDMVETVLKAMKSGDFKEVEKMTGYNSEIQEGDEENTKQMMKLLYSDMSWSFVSGEIKEGKGDLVYKIKTKDLGELFVKLFAGAMSGKLNPDDDAAMLKFMEESTKSMNPTEKEITFNVAKEGEEFKFTNIEDAMVKAMGLDTDMFGGLDNNLGDDESGEDGSLDLPENKEVKEIAIGETVQVNGNDFTIKSFQKVNTWTEGQKAIKMVFSWKNNGDSEDAAFANFIFTAYQKGVEVDSLPLSDSIDLSIAQKNIQPGIVQDNCETGFVIENDDIMEIKINAMFSFGGQEFSIKVNPADVKE